jgi:hypothetical protein
MLTKEKVLLIAKAIIQGKASDSQLLALGLNEADLDLLFTGAEKCVDKARNKPEIRPEGEALLEAVRSWIDYYDWP